MNRFEKIIDKINNIPESLINTLSLISGIITIITPIIGYFKIKRNIKAGTVGHISSQLIIIILILFGSIVLLMFLRMRKYRKLLMLSRHSVSEGVYKFLHDFRNLYFGLTKTHKNGEDSVSTLTREVKEYTINSLNELCNIFNSFTRKKICASIKLIETEDGEFHKEIDIDKATVKTFARSSNMDLNRGERDKSRVGPKLKEDTAFVNIINSFENNSKSYFYKQDLEKYSKAMSEAGTEYKSCTNNWRQFYRGTIVVPIRIAHEHLSYTTENTCYDVIGFLCIDSLSKNAFLKNQERYNCLLAKAFAAEMYVVLSKYRYYLYKIYERQKNGKDK